MCDIFGCCNEPREKRYEWLEKDESPNREAIEALRRQQYSRDIELPERIDGGRPVPASAPQKRFDTVLDLGGAKGVSSSDGGGRGGSVYKKGDRKTEGQSPPKERPKSVVTGEGQRLGGGTATPAGADSDADAGAKAREAALKRMEAPPQGFSAAGTHKMKNAK
jgi:hypothetical protein